MRRGRCRLSLRWVLLSVSLGQCAAARPQDGSEPPQGERLYAAHCAGCHGALGEGVYGPPLAGIVTAKYPDIAAMMALINAGTAQGMPPFHGKLTSEQLRLVADYVRSLPSSP